MNGRDDGNTSSAALTVQVPRLWAEDSGGLLSMGGTPAGSPGLVTFGVYELDLHCGELRKCGSRLSLQQQPAPIALGPYPQSTR